MKTHKTSEEIDAIVARGTEAFLEALLTLHYDDEDQFDQAFAPSPPVDTE